MWLFASFSLKNWNLWNFPRVTSSRTPLSSHLAVGESTCKKKQEPLERAFRKVFLVSKAVSSLLCLSLLNREKKKKKWRRRLPEQWQSAHGNLRYLPNLFGHLTSFGEQLRCSCCFWVGSNIWIWVRVLLNEYPEHLSQSLSRFNLVATRFSPVDNSFRSKPLVRSNGCLVVWNAPSNPTRLLTIALLGSI